MSNRWGIPKEVEEFVRSRDLNCIYCGVEFNEAETSFKSKPSWEHIINDIRLSAVDNIGLCCRSCNASKGSKLLQDWLNSSYCARKGITANTVADVVKDYLSKIEFL